MNTLLPTVRAISRTFCIALALSVAACGGDDTSTMHDDMMTEDGMMAREDMMTEDGMMHSDTSAAVRMDNGVQVAEIEAGPMGYVPSTLTLEAGVPARLVFTRTVDAECSAQVQIPDAGVPLTDLPLGKPVAVTFTPQQGGTYRFVCGMDMQHGTIAVRS